MPGSEEDLVVESVVEIGDMTVLAFVVATIIAWAVVVYTVDG